jgi:hypothetical protein
MGEHPWPVWPAWPVLPVARQGDGVMLASAICQRPPSPTYLKDVLGGSAGRRSRLDNSMGDRAAVLQSVAEADHLVAVVLIASIGGTRRRWEAVALLPQAQRVRAYVEHRGCLVDRERGSTLLHRMYRQPGQFL